MQKIDISVIVPIFNSEKYLNECLKSLTCQKSDKIEIICVNDGSSDSSLEIVEKFLYTDERIKVINQDNLGTSNARNKGIEVAKGDYISFVDSDDWVDPYFYKKLYKSANENNADISACAYSMYYNKNKKFKFNNPKYKLEFFKEIEQPFNIEKIGGEIFNLNYESCTKIYKRSFLNNHGIKFKDLTFGEDLAFYYECLINAKKVTAVFDQMYYYRKQIETQSSSNIDKYTEQAIVATHNADKVLYNYKNFEKIKYNYYDKKIDLFFYWLLRVKDKEKQELFFQKIKQELILCNFKNEEIEKLKNKKILISLLNDNYYHFIKKYENIFSTILRKIFK